MTADADLITAISRGDEAACQALVERYAAPLFRYCRLNLNDHFRAGDFVEREMAEWVRHVMDGDIPVTGIGDLFQRVRQHSEAYLLEERGKGLSGKQKRILELMESLPMIERLALDLVWLENRSREDVTRWLSLKENTILEVEIRFKQILGADDKIKEFLEYAAIQQVRQQAARRRSESETIRKKPPETGAFRPAGTGRPSGAARRPGGQGREDGPGGHGTRPGTGDAGKTGGTGKDAGGHPETGSDGTDAKRSESRPRRRRVDPRKLDFEI
ncbi:MAG TPA: hypothetical protein PLV45_15755 [bacterium]|nr:hypothetical protein [bacterium]